MPAVIQACMAIKSGLAEGVMPEIRRLPTIAGAVAGVQGVSLFR